MSRTDVVTAYSTILDVQEASSLLPHGQARCLSYELVWQVLDYSQATQIPRVAEAKVSTVGVTDKRCRHVARDCESLAALANSRFAMERNLRIEMDVNQADCFWEKRGTERQ